MEVTNRQPNYQSPKNQMPIFFFFNGVLTLPTPLLPCYLGPSISSTYMVVQEAWGMPSSREFIPSIPLFCLTDTHSRIRVKTSSVHFSTLQNEIVCL